MQGKLRYLESEVFWFILTPGALVHRQAPFPFGLSLSEEEPPVGREGMKKHICFNVEVPNLYV